MRKLRVFTIVLTINLLTTSCTPKDDSTASLVENTETVKTIETDTKPKVKFDPEFNKTLREAIYFSNSLEREALKLILKNNSLQKLTLFSVLSYIAEINAGVKKTTPYGLDCGKFDIKREQKTIRIFKSCIKPDAEIAKIQVLKEDSLYEIEFLIKEWAGVVGLPVTLVGENVLCQLEVKSRKLYRLKCDNWSYQTESNQTSSTVMKAKDFLFQRDAVKQFVIKGGFFKELIENKKIDISVPMEGKIKIIEKEIKVIDEFANRISEDKKNQESSGTNEKKESSKKENNEESYKESQQKNNQEVGQEINQEASQSGSVSDIQESQQAIGAEINTEEAQSEVNSADASRKIDINTESHRGRGR